MVRVSFMTASHVAGELGKEEEEVERLGWHF